jgi:hypothetical protein
MRLPWKARHHRDSDVRVTNKVNLDEVDDRSRSYTTTVERPDQWAPLDHSRATYGADRETAMLMVVQNVHRALDASSVDEYVSDFMDARINTALTGWQEAVDHEAAARKHTTLGLMAVELENITRVQSTIKAERQTVADLQASVTGWRQVLLGHSDHAPLPAESVGNLSAITPELPTIPGHSTIADLLTEGSRADHEQNVTTTTAHDPDAGATAGSPISYITFDKEQAT